MKEKSFIPSKKQIHLFNIASEVAKTSNFKKKNCRIRLGALLYKSGRIISSGENSNKTSSFATRFFEHGTLHAEIKTILGIPYDLTKGADIYIVRLYNDDSFALSRPCSMCLQALSFVGVKNAYYSVGNNRFKKLRIN